MLVLLALNAGIAIAVAHGWRHEASAWPGSGFTFWPERSWQQVESRIRALAASERFARRDIGQVRYGRAGFPVHLLHFAANAGGARPLKVLLVSGVHGTETAGVEALLQIAEGLARNPREHPSVSFDIVPVLNPWGWVHGYRYNGEGEDVNRDFSSGRTQEARILRDYMRRNGPWDLVVDLHESKKYGYFIYQYLPPGSGLGAEFVRILKALGKPRENAYQEGFFPAKGGILQVPAPALAWVALAGRLSLEQYARLGGTRNSYTVETPLWDDFSDRVTVHRKTIEAFLAFSRGRG